MNDAKTSLIGKIDNLAYHGIHYYGKKQRTGSSFFSGCLWAYLDFAYVIADDGSVQDSLDNLSEMAMETSEDVMFDKGYNRAAKRIAEIQRDILTISNNEQPFDVFICYKESDNYGRRTKDSVTAQITSVLKE